MHVLPSSGVPDHCLAFALSYQGDTDYVSACSHDHDLTCDRCDLLTNVVCEIESTLENVEISSDEKGEMKYMAFQAKKRIEAWKAHLLRSINQDEARLDAINNLGAHSVLFSHGLGHEILPEEISRESSRLVWKERNFLAYSHCYEKVQKSTTNDDVYAYFSKL